MSARFIHGVRRAAALLGKFAVYVLIWLSLVLLITAIGIHINWGTISISQMLLNLVSVQVAGGGGGLVIDGIIFIGVVPVLVTVGIAVARHFWLKSRRKHPERRSSTKSRWIFRSVGTVVVAGVAVLSTAAFSSAVELGSYINASIAKDNIGDYDVAPQVTGDEHKHNLVLLYLESGEQTLANDQLFEKDAFAPLEAVTQPSDGFSSIDNYQQYEGGGWTMAGVTSTQCGIPLKGPGSSLGSAALNGLGGDISSYLAGASCLGDVLSQHGYTNEFIGGASGSFAAKDVFLKDHGFTIQKDLNDWRAAGDPPEDFRPTGGSATPS